MKEEDVKVRADVPRKIRGTLTILAEDDMEFRAQRSTGASMQKNISTKGESKIYETVGEKQSKTIAHLVVKQGDSDPVSTLYDQLDSLTKNMSSKVNRKVRGRFIMNEPSCQVVCSKKEKKIDIRLTIDLVKNPNYVQELMNKMYKINQCFAINQTFLVNARS